MNTNARLSNESFEDFRKRIATDKKLTKILLRGYLIWDSSPADPKDPLSKGRTYSKKLYGDLRNV